MVRISKIIAAAGILGVIGISALPIASGYAAPVTDESDVDVTVKVTEGISVEASENYVANFGAAGDKTDSSLTDIAVIGSVIAGQKGGATETTPGTVTVVSNVTAGYTLTIADKDTDTDLSSTTPDGTPGTLNMIPALAAHAAGTPGWAVDFGSTAGSMTLSGTRKAMPASTGTALQIASATTVSASGTGDVYPYAFSSSISGATLPGDYTNTVTFTVVSK